MVNGGSARLWKRSLRAAAVFGAILLILLSTTLLYLLVARREEFDYAEDVPPRYGRKTLTYDGRVEESEGWFAEDGACSRCQWSNAEERRIFQSVRQEHSMLFNELKKTKTKLEEVIRTIPLKETELAELTLHINELRILQKELNDKRNVRLMLPDQPLYLQKNNFLQRGPETTDSFSDELEENIDYRRCSISTRFPVYLYDSGVPSSLHLEFAKQQMIIRTPEKACIFVAVLRQPIATEKLIEDLPYWRDMGGRNHLVVITGSNSTVDTSHFGPAMVVASKFRSFRPRMDIAVNLDVPDYDLMEWRRLPRLLTDSKAYFLSYIKAREASPILDDEAFAQLRASMEKAQDPLLLDLDCTLSPNGLCYEEEKRMQILRQSTYALIPLDVQDFQHRFYEALLGGAIPALVYTHGFQLSLLPFADLIDWRLAVISVARPRFPELHYILRSISVSDTLELRRKGRLYFEGYLLNTKVLASAILAAVRYRLQIPAEGEKDVEAIPLFPSHSFEAPTLRQIVPATRPPYDDEYLGPVEVPQNSNFYTHNLTSLSMFSYRAWNELPHTVSNTPATISQEYPMPSGAEYNDAYSFDMRPISPGSGQEFALALGGNRQREQFTIVILSYRRDTLLAATLERLHQLPYLNKIIVIWNEPDREPPSEAWPKLHVPVLFIRAATNSLNNRFIPYDQLTTEAILSIDDDIVFRVWREQRHRIVGFPARYHANYDGHLFYNSNHTCQLSMVLTGAAFIHKSYFYAYTYHMPAIIRTKVDEWMNCEDIAMNFLVSHLTREPPVKTTSKWTLRCPTCPETALSPGLQDQDEHFNERHNCIRFFIEVYGYNPLLYSQFRADSVLFKTRVPVNHQKCFRYV